MRSSVCFLLLVVLDDSFGSDRGHYQRNIRHDRVQVHADASDIGAPWFQSDLGGFADWTFIATGPQHGQLDSNADGNVLGFSNTSGFVYQQVGTYAGETSATISGDAVARGAGGLNGATFSVWETPIATTGSDGTWVGLLAGASLLDSDAFTGGYSAGAFNFNLDVSGATAGNKIWIGIDQVGVETFLDSLSLTPVPEPSGLLTIVVFGLIAACSRRRRN